MVVDDKTDDEQLLQMAIKAARSGQKDGARVMLRQVYTNNKRNETALMWLAKLAKNEKERKEWLKIILDLNPNNQAAQKALDNLSYQREAKDNRTILLFGTISIVMFILIIAIILLALNSVN